MFEWFLKFCYWLWVVLWRALRRYFMNGRWVFFLLNTILMELGQERMDDFRIWWTWVSKLTWTIQINYYSIIIQNYGPNALAINWKYCSYKKNRLAFYWSMPSWQTSFKSSTVIVIWFKNIIIVAKVYGFSGYR